MYRTFDVTVHVFDGSTLPGEVPQFSPNILRWVIIRDYLLNLPARRYKWVMLSDVSDTVFQRDPFYLLRGRPDADGVYAFLEDGGVLIRDCYYNRIWIAACYGEPAAVRAQALPRRDTAS